jgi:hypothetical protein
MSVNVDVREFFDQITSQGITPNEFYLLCSMRESIAPVLINTTNELNTLKGKRWVGDDNKLSDDAVRFIDKMDKYFRISKKKTSATLLGNDFENNIVKYLSLFPKIKLPNGKYARSDRKQIENAFRWFFETYDYPWDTILEATVVYVNEYQRKNWLYMRTSQFFIRKQESDKTFMSDLAVYCENYMNGTDDNESFIKERIV